MNDNVVKLRPDNKQDLIDIAEKLLGEAQRSELKAIALVTIHNQTTATGYNVQTYGEAETLLGAVAVLQHRILIKIEHLSD